MRPLRVPPGAPLTAVLHVTKGLADVAEAELAELVPAATVVDRTDRFLLVRLPVEDLAAFGARARTVDDVRLLVAGPAPVATEDDLRRLAADAATAVTEIIDDPGDTWSITLATRNPPWKRKPRWDPASVLAAELHGADPAATERSAVDLRLQVEDAQAHLAVNLWDRPVGKADDDVPPYRGALRPTVAAAMVRTAVAACSPAARDAGLYDPFCGSGTIVAEAVRAGLGVHASDDSEEALTITRVRLAALGVPEAELAQQVFARDVRRGPDQRVTVPHGGHQPAVGRPGARRAAARAVRRPLHPRRQAHRRRRCCRAAHHRTRTRWRPASAATACASPPAGSGCSARPRAW